MSGANCPIPVGPVQPMDPMLPIVYFHTVMLYDATTGAIAHVHQEATAVGAVAPTAAQAEAKARSIYARMQQVPMVVSALHFNEAARDLMDPFRTYKVIDCALVQG